MNNKKGLSTIVATVLIILLVIAAVTLVWGPIRNMISKQSEEAEANCLMANPTITKACMDSDDLKVTISNGAEVAIDKFQIIYGDNEESLNNTYPSSDGVGLNIIVTKTVPNAAGVPAVVRIAAIIDDQTCNAGEPKTVADNCA